MGVPVNYDVPANLQEALALPGSSEELVYKSFLKQVLYHGSYGAIRAKVSDLLEKTGISKRQSLVGKKLVSKTEKEVDEKIIKVWTFDETSKELTGAQVDKIETETDAQFAMRVCAEGLIDEAAFAELVQRAADETPFDVTRKERTAAEKKANKTHIKIATDIADNGVLERVAAQLALDLGRDIDVTCEREEAINNLALAIGENERREAEARKNKYIAMGS